MTLQFSPTRINHREGPRQKLQRIHRQKAQPSGRPKPTEDLRALNPNFHLSIRGLHFALSAPTGTSISHLRFALGAPTGISIRNLHFAVMAPTGILY